MTLSIISQDGTVFNYTNAIACVTCGEYEDDSGFGFMQEISFVLRSELLRVRTFRKKSSLP